MQRAPGNVVLRRVATEDGYRVEVLEADPVIEIAEEVLEVLDPAAASLDGDVLTIDAANRRLVYRIDRASYDPFRRTYLAEWPD